jgi:hypothetical protein
LKRKWCNMMQLMVGRLDGWPWVVGNFLDQSDLDADDPIRWPGLLLVLGGCLCSGFAVPCTSSLHTQF